MLLTGAEITIECLKEQGVDVVFGYPGGAVINIYDSLYKNRDSIKHILTSHEQGATHAADGYARSTGKVGVCMATSGPGATNLVTGIATAYLDSVPLVAITVNVLASMSGRDSFQEVDIASVTMSITKHNFVVKDINKLADTIRRAFYVAQEGRPGPVLIDIPKDITIQATDYVAKKPQEITRQVKGIDSNGGRLKEAQELIRKSQRPLIFAGGGVIRSEACQELRSFAETIKAPVANSLMGLGGFPADHQLFTGMMGMHGSLVSSKAVTECDLLIAIGTRFSDRTVCNVKGFAPKAKIIHIDIDPLEINKNVQVDCPIIGDVKTVLKKLNQPVEASNREVWLKKIKNWKDQYEVQDAANEEELKPYHILAKIQELTKGEAIITTEVGQNQMWTAQHYKFTKPRTFISSGGLGTMGYGLGASIGTQIGNPEKTVINIAGDGSFVMNCNELATAVKYNIPIIVVILNNRSLGMVRQWQSLFFQGRYSETVLDRQTDFVKVAEAFGATGFTIRKPQEIHEVLIRALETEGPVIVNCEINKDEMVYPMVAPGASINEMITEKSLG
ncbi:biosynthetic-type acetolactate synthase large subunit [Alkaliphilus peptidifermentans]|uniref:Acetolactate synthase n=1 Tax=Alkaliphilus peptidifermentans DSM 18978 TaxID=1120976 RepID=A0A1G5JL99_9FIRM|nr:biosynthetic-type acetolactate synthase large subunit [Alkaliphilus peptidifermentans]SCY89182.1 acetolactate synthase, large subunit [Alkaliphilus peptidifermentans DSM 18978]